MEIFQKIPIAMILSINDKYVYNEKAKEICKRLEIKEGEFFSKLDIIEKSGFEISQDGDFFIIQEYQIENLFNRVGHELRTPLTGIMAVIESIREEYQEDKLEIIEQETFRLYEMTEKLLCAIAAKNNELVVLKSIFSSKELMFGVERDIQLISKNYAGKKIKIDKYEEFQMFADRKKIEFIILELVENSLRYMGDFGIIRIRLEKNEENVVISVKDTGKGVGKTTLDNLGTMYYKEKTGEDGIGCGLFCCRKIMEKHEGIFEIKSEEGMGFEVRLEIPSL